MTAERTATTPSSMSRTQVPLRHSLRQHTQDGKVAGTRIDRIRLKVWKSANGQVLFDTEPGISEIAPPATIVNGGNVTLHR